MTGNTVRIAACSLPVLALALTAGKVHATESEKSWTIYVANDNCPDYTWGLTEEQTRQAFADIVKGHLDEMTRTDGQPPENRSRYNMAVAQEALCFVEHYPDRKEELIRRIKEGRVYVSPYLCNTLWAFQTAEGTIRAFYPARRLEQQWGFTIACAHHIELPSLPWGTATLLAGCGFRSLSVPYLGYDSTFGGLKNPPLFFLEGPDGSRIKVWLDRWASSKSHYTQGAAILRNPDSIKKDWIPHYRDLGDSYPLRAILASGTHGDISPHAGNQARGFAEALIKHNARPDKTAKLVNAAFPQFWQAVDQAQSENTFLPTYRGSLGHSWDLWPVCLAKYVAAMREGERRLLAAETLLAVAAKGQPALYEATRPDRQRAEWCWAMLADHAWNGTNEANKRHNAELRRRWSEELNRIGRKLLKQGWSAAGIVPDSQNVLVFNSLSLPRSGLVRIEGADGVTAAVDRDRRLPIQMVREGAKNSAYFVVPNLPGFSFKQFKLTSDHRAKEHAVRLRASADMLEGPYYRVVIDRSTGGVGSLVHKATGVDLVASGGGRSLCQTVYFDGKDHLLEDVQSEVVALGPVLARLRIRGTAPGLEVDNYLTVYSDLDRMDFDVRIRKVPSAKQERLCHVFPIVHPRATLRVATPGAVVRPRPKPDGDLLPGADTRRFAVQEFVNISDERLNVTLVPLDAFVLRLDLDPICFEALGNDQNHREVLRDQNGVKEFRFRYSLRAQPGGYKGPQAVAFSRTAATPPLAILGRFQGRQPYRRPAVTFNPARAVATCFKPADGDPSRGCLIRLWETAGHSGPLRIVLAGFSKAVETDLLERDRRPLDIVDGRIEVDLKAHGYAAVRLVP